MFAQYFLYKNIVSGSSFDTGMRLYYWQFYQEEPLIVEKRYSSFKEEILTHVTQTVYQQTMMKAQQYFNTNKAKSMRAYRYPEDDRHYGIHNDSPLNIWHLMSVILYCDITQLCTQFSKSFRSIEAGESSTSIKSRNSEFWWMAKALNETVTYYGNHGRILCNGESGPFFCGIDCPLTIPEFAITLNGPTSTTKHIEVAIRFATRDGIILQLNNNGDIFSRDLMMFDCSWISQYPEESEIVHFL